MGEEISFTYNHPIEKQFTDSIIRPGGIKLTAQLLEIAGLSEGATIVDIGCGTGVTVEYLLKLGYQAIGIDQSVSLLNEGLSRQPTLNLIKAKAEELPFANTSFDAVLGECSLSIMEHKRDVLQECNRILKPSGMLILSDIYMRQGQVDCHGFFGLHKLFSYDEWQEQLKETGFILKKWEDSSSSWKNFVAQMIWNEINIAHLIDCSIGEKVDKDAFLKLGYFLLVAEKV
jgi:arsenite methyltransferase